MANNSNKQEQFNVDEIEAFVNEQAQLQSDNQQIQQSEMSSKTQCDDFGIRPEIKYADPAQTGYLPLIDMFEPVVMQIKKQFNLTADINDIWLHINHKMFSEVPRQNLALISPYNVLEHLYTCVDNNLNPLKPEVASYYVADMKNRIHSIKTQILLEGYNKIYSTHPQSNGLEYQIYADVEREFTETEWVTNPETRRREPKKKLVKKMVPSRVECRIYRKDMDHPTVGFAFPDDIGNTGAWQGHPSQMMCNRAFTRAVRMAYNLEGTSAEDVAEISHQNAVNNHSTYDVETENKYEKTTLGVIGVIANCSTLEELNSQIGIYRPVLDKLPGEYQHRVLMKVQEVNSVLRKKKLEQNNVQKTVQQTPTNQNLQPNEAVEQGFDFEQQLIS